MRLRTVAVLQLLLAVVLVLPTAAQDQAIADGGFRGFAWGTPVSEVATGETATLIRQDASLAVYRDTWNEMTANVIYFFNGGQLVMGFYQILVQNEELETFFEDYHRIKYYIIGDLGEPSVENWQHAAQDIQDDREAWAGALGFGLLKVETGWSLGDSEVALRLSGGDFAGHLLVACTSKSELQTGRLAFREYFRRKVGVPNPYFVQ